MNPSIWKVMCCAVLAILLSHAARSASTEENKETVKTASAEIDALISGGIPDAQKELAERSLKLIDQLLQDWRLDQDRMYAFVRSLDDNIASIDCLQDAECVKFKQRVLNKSAELLVSTYSDSIGQNSNLSNQLKVRLPLLLADSLKLQQGGAPSRKAFETEFNTIADRWLRSNRFRAGIGVSYNYLPSVNFRGRERVDFSPFLPSSVGGADTLLYDSNFGNKSFPSLALSAEMPFVTLDATFPMFDTTNTIITPVQIRAIEGGPSEILSRSTIVSKMSVEFDVSARLSVFKVAERLVGSKYWNSQADLGLGMGVTGFDLQNSVTTDARFRNDGSTVFNDLPAGETISGSNSASFSTVYVFGYYDFRLTDTITAGAHIRHYNDTTSEGTEAVVEDLTLGIYFFWYPTFPWEK